MLGPEHTKVKTTCHLHPFCGGIHNSRTHVPYIIRMNGSTFMPQACFVTQQKNIFLYNFRLYTVKNNIYLYSSVLSSRTHLIWHSCTVGLILQWHEARKGVTSILTPASLSLVNDPCTHRVEMILLLIPLYNGYM